MIKSTLIIVLCSVLSWEAVFPNVDVTDILSFPEIFIHYEVHLKESPEIGFAEYLVLHYFDSDHLASSPTDHRELPFSKTHYYRTFFQFLDVPPIISLEPAYTIAISTPPTRKPIQFISDVVSNIWQPPRI